MRITVKGKNVNVTDPLQRYSEKKVEKLAKYSPNIREAIVTQSVQRNWHIVEVTLEGEGILFRGEERTDNMYASIDQVVDKLEKQLKRFKEKLQERSHPEEPPKEQPVALEVTQEEAREEAQETAEIVRTKAFAMKPMTPEDAAMQMEMLNHDFYVFRNSENDLISVIYKRQDGNYGLIEPEA